MKHGKWSVLIVLCLFPAYVVQAGDIPGGLLPGDFPDPKPAKVEKKATEGAGQQETKKRIEAERRAAQAEREKRALAEELAQLKAAQAAENARLKQLSAGVPAPSVAQTSPQPPAAFADPFEGKMVAIPLTGKSFQMGADNGASDEKPPHPVTISQAYELGKTEVTKGQWRAVTGNNPPGVQSKNCDDDCPVDTVSWGDVQTFIEKLNKMTGKQYRLPTEAEWEYACRAGGTHTYCGSDDIGSVAWYAGNSGGMTHPVAKLQKNAWGLYDMSGNVWEWVEDSYHDSYKNDGTRPDDGRAWEGDGKLRVLRGGNWYYDPQYARSAKRLGFDPRYRNLSHFGFRLARTAPSIVVASKPTPTSQHLAQSDRDKLAQEEKTRLVNTARQKAETGNEEQRKAEVIRQEQEQKSKFDAAAQAAKLAAATKEQDQAKVKDIAQTPATCEVVLRKYKMELMARADGDKSLFDLIERQTDIVVFIEKNIQHYEAEERKGSQDAKDTSKKLRRLLEEANVALFGCVGEKSVPLNGISAR